MHYNLKKELINTPITEDNKESFKTMLYEVFGEQAEIIKEEDKRIKGLYNVYENLTNLSIKLVNALKST